VAAGHRFTSIGTMGDAASQAQGGEPTRAVAGRAVPRAAGLIAQVEAVIRDPYGRRDMSPLCTWDDWHRRMRLLESAPRQGTETFTENDFRDASSLLQRDRASWAGVDGVRYALVLVGHARCGPGALARIRYE
jgi:hypothetical protein